MSCRYYIEEETKSGFINDSPASGLLRLYHSAYACHPWRDAFIFVWSRPGHPWPCVHREEAVLNGFVLFRLTYLRANEVAKKDGA